ncbi:MAG: hypothetical protein F6K40_11675 [Okeania sp. SIO3I5]|uniref:RAMP superfamily CRISPR-associated protein n=1 Tax=Okeania sp. SIO3I5 TaxID=2607805 RepID=UPI0013B8DDA2|nr:RAMP superfamily CRISPR-associated protein [Okeania sp. SIO3I5]NEQ36901.1 hypothetical protein [Okeania sp. SIO3I5]
MKAIEITLKIEQPVLVNSFQGDPNSDVSYSYIPGSALRGALISRYMRQNRIRELDLANPEVKRLFFDADKTSYLNAYLLSQDNQRTLPLPRSWFKNKDDEFNDKKNSVTAYDFSLRESDEDEDEDIEPESPKAVGDYFWVKDSKKEILYLYKEKRRINIHNRRNRKKGKGTPEEGEIFRYEALDAGQTFQAIILYQEDNDKTIFERLLEVEKLQKSDREKSDLWLGGSQSAGYGHTKIINIEFLDTWDEIGATSQKREGDNLIVTLLSDGIFRDDITGQVIANSDLVKQEIEHILGSEKKLSLPTPVYAASTLIGGFNRKWGLPLPQVSALAAGSVFVFKNVNITASEIEELENKGIGERRVDGFGRIAINWAVKWGKKESFSVEKPDEKEDEKQLDEYSLKSEVSRSLAELMAERILKQKLEQEVQKKVDSWTPKGPISNSQLSRLRIVAREGLTLGSRLPVLRLLCNLPASSKAKFQQTKIENVPLDKKIYEMLRKPTCWMSNLQELEGNVAGVSKKLSQRLAIEYTLRLIMAIAKNAIKEKQND